MKIDIVICILILILSAAVPAAVYITFNDNFSSQAKAHTEGAEKYVKAASDIESGRKKVYIESIPTSLRLNAQSERSFAEVFKDYKSANKEFFIAALWSMLLQGVMLIILLKRRQPTRQLLGR